MRKARSTEQSLATVQQPAGGAVGGPSAELATYQRMILRAAASGINSGLSAEQRVLLDSWALAKLQSGSDRDKRAAAHYVLTMRQRDIAAANALTDAIRVQEELEARAREQSPSFSDMIMALPLPRVACPNPPDDHAE